MVLNVKANCNISTLRKANIIGFSNENPVPISHILLHYLFCPRYDYPYEHRRTPKMMMMREIGTTLVNYFRDRFNAIFCLTNRKEEKKWRFQKQIAKLRMAIDTVSSTERASSNRLSSIDRYFFLYLYPRYCHDGKKTTNITNTKDDKRWRANVTNVIGIRVFLYISTQSLLKQLFFLYDTIVFLIVTAVRIKNRY